MPSMVRMAGATWGLSVLGWSTEGSAGLALQEVGRRCGGLTPAGI